MRTRDWLREAVHGLSLQITIDGPAGAGKSTVGRGLAQAIVCRCLDTGLMYRAVTIHALAARIPPSDAVQVAGVARSLHFALSPSPDCTLRIDGQSAGPELRTAAVEEAVSEVSAHPEVRSALVARQRDLAASDCIVMVGRDIGTVVLPAAPVKLWVTAAAEERARRRTLDSGSTGYRRQGVSRVLKQRDAVDTGRSVSPLLRPTGAVVIDTSCLSPAQALDMALAAVRAGVEQLLSARVREDD